MRVIETKVYKFAELSSDAQARVLDRLCEFNVCDSYWHESVTEDAKACGAILGIEAREIYFSGFSSQGDGACFVGSYNYTKGCVAAIMEHAPQDAELARIARELVRIQRPAKFRAWAGVKHRGHYYHSGCTEIDCETEHGSLDVDALRTALRDFMDWIYDQLRREYDYLTSREQVIESITANELEFTEDGSRP